MAVVPVIISGVFYPKNKMDKPMPGTFVGNAAIAGLEVGGGPVLPPDEVPPVDPPLVIWGGPFDPPHVDNSLPVPPTPPVDPPTTPEKPHEGWNWSAVKSGWYFLYIPGAEDPQPKRPGLRG